MKRRKFFERTALTSTGMLFFPGWLKAAMEAGTFPGGEQERKILVIIQLSGGNDGLNMIVPYTDPLYYRARPTLAIPAGQVLKASPTLGFNPVMSGIKELYDEQKVCIINNVGYPHPNRSHFRSMDIWQTAGDADQYLSTGWIGRWMGTLPSQERKPYMAIEEDDRLSLALRGDRITGIAMRDPQQFYKTLQRGFFRPLVKAGPTGPSGNPSLDYLWEVMRETVGSADYIREKTAGISFVRPQTKSKNPLNESLSTIAGMIRAGLATRVYYTSLDGFDTHVQERQRQDRLLKIYSEAVSAFVRQIDEQGLSKNVLLFTFSEFGRRVEENASGGTDHGCANNVLLIGGDLKHPGVFNEDPNLSDLDHGDLKYTVDFRSLYATLLHDWLESDPVKVLGKKFPRPELFG